MVNLLLCICFLFFVSLPSWWPKSKLKVQFQDFENECFMHVEKNKDTSDTCDIYLSIKMHVFGINVN